MTAGKIPPFGKTQLMVKLNLAEACGLSTFEKAGLTPETLEVNHI